MITLPLDPEGYSVQITMATLRHIHIPSLHTIRLEFHGFRAYGSQIFPPMEVDDPAPEEPLLDVAAFPRLQHIELVFYDLPEVINYAGLAERFAGAASRGVAVKRIHETTLLDLDIL